MRIIKSVLPAALALGLSGCVFDGAANMDPRDYWPQNPERAVPENLKEVIADREEFKAMVRSRGLEISLYDIVQIIAREMHIVQQLIQNNRNAPLHSLYEKLGRFSKKLKEMRPNSKAWWFTGVDVSDDQFEEFFTLQAELVTELQALNSKGLSMRIIV
jgi:hypothetical protein